MFNLNFNDLTIKKIVIKICVSILLFIKIAICGTLEPFQLLLVIVMLIAK